MSYYTVNTTNAFAALDLSDEEPRIRPSTEAPKVVEEEPVAPAPKKEASPQKRGGRGGRGPARPRQPAGEDAPEEVETRNTRAGAPRTKRGGRGDNYQPRAGKKVFDKKTNPAAMKKDDDTNPDHEAEDEAAADAIVAKEEAERSEEAVEVEPVEKEPARVTIQQYMASLAGERIANADSAPSVDSYTDLNREIADAGFKPIAKSVEEETGRAPGASKIKKSQGEGKHQDVFAAVGATPQLNRPGQDDRRNRREQKPQKTETETPVAPSKKALKDESEFPSLC